MMQERESALFVAAFGDAQQDQRMKLSLCIALYAGLILMWMPGMSFGSVTYAEKEQKKPGRIAVLKPPPEIPVDRPELLKTSVKKVPMPDQTPNDPEPVVAANSLSTPDMVYTDPWEIRIPEPKAPQNVVHLAGAHGVESPIFTSRTRPNYPKQAMALRITGYVILEAVMRKDGEIDDIKVVRGLAKGRFGFEEEAAKALSKWEFLPGKVNGKAVDVRMTLRIDYQVQ